MTVTVAPPLPLVERVVTRYLAGHPLLRLAEVGSTNDVARDGVVRGELAHGAVVLADRQTAGRGRRGRAWTTIPGRSLATSVVIQTPPLERPSRVTLLAAVAMARALEAAGAPPIAIKWPNDLMRGDRKIGGILVEPVLASDGRAHLVVGLGVNLALESHELPDDLAAIAGDAGLSSADDARERVLAAFLREFDEALDAIGGPGDAARGEEYRRRSWLTGRCVRVRTSGIELQGEVIDVGPEGDLTLRPVGGPDRTLRGEFTELVTVDD